MPTLDASSSPTSRKPRGTSVRSTWRSMDPPAGPLSTGVPLHAHGGPCKTVGAETKDEDGHVVAGLFLSEAQHGLLDPARDGFGVESKRLPEHGLQAVLAEDMVAGPLLDD